MNKFPVIKLSSVFILGILIQYLLNIDLLILFISSTTLIAFSLCGLYFYKKVSYLSFFLYLPIITLSAFSYGISKAEIKTYPFELNKNKDSRLYGMIKKIELPKQNQIIFEAEVDSVQLNKLYHTKGYIFLCKLRYDDSVKVRNLYSELKVGQKFTMTGLLYRAKEKRNPGEFDYQKYLHQKGIQAIFLSKDRDEFIITDSSSSALNNFIHMARVYVDGILSHINNDQASSLLRGLLLADRSLIDYETRSKFVNAGVIHVLAVSGLHVGFIALIFVFLFGRFNIHLRLTLTIIGLIGFLLLTGHPPSVFRATIMAIVVIITILTGRTYNGINSLSIAALFLLILNPIDLFNPGFQLSFSAVLSIMVIHPIIKNMLDQSKIENKIIKNILVFASVSLAATLGTLPFTLIYFQKLSIVGLFLNIFVIPLIGIIVSIGIFSLLLFPISGFLVSVYSTANEFFIKLLFSIVDFADSLKFSHLDIVTFSLYDSIVYLFFLVIFLSIIRKIVKSSARILFTIMLLANLVLYLSLDNKSLLPDDKLSIFMIDVGQGDGIIIKFPDGTTALLDAGNATPYFDTGERVIKPLLKNLGIDSIDIGFVSHMDSDHYKGFNSLIKTGVIKSIYKPKLDGSFNKDVRLENLAKRNNIPINHYSKTFLDFGDARLYILSDTNDVIYNSFDVNNKSGVFKIVHGKNEFLFVGDAEIEAEEYLVNRYKHFLKADILKVGHHGSKTSSTQNLLNYAKPQTGLISAGIQNKFNHPSPSVIKRFKKNKIELYRTDLQGAIFICSDGETIEHIDWREF